jgi:hypothetical protein
VSLSERNSVDILNSSEVVDYCNPHLQGLCDNYGIFVGRGFGHDINAVKSKRLSR